MVLQSPDPREMEKLGLSIVNGKVVDDQGKAIPAKQFKDIKKKLNWNIIGPGIAILIFVLGWVSVVSERAYTATVNAEKITEQTVTMTKQDSQIDELKKANERQEIMINTQTQILKKQDSIMDISRQYHDKRSEAIERDVVGELRSLRIDLKDMKSELSELKNMLRSTMHRRTGAKPPTTDDKPPIKE